MSGGIKYHTPIRKKYAKNVKQLIILVIGVIIGACSGVYAATSISSSVVSYSNSKTSATTVKEALDEIMTKSTCLTAEYLSDVAHVGDYVAYDAGSWTSTADKPTSQGNFGGYTSGQNKANSVSWCRSSDNTTNLKGWRVLSVDRDTKTVTLVHAGMSECYYHDRGGYSSVSITVLNNRATSEYLNSDYASSVHMMTKDEAYAITGSTDATTNDLRYIGDSGATSNSAEYWLTLGGNMDTLWYVTNSGSLSWNYIVSYGIRPVIVLKPYIKTTGKGTDVVGQEAWTLVKP